MRIFSMLRNFALNVGAGAPETEQGIGELIQIDFSRLSGTLKHMGLGMLSIFIVIGVIVLFIILLQKLTNRQPKKNKTEE